jgi:dTDP-4-amino-4,6-dideoxygalactose transaminase
MIPISRPWLEEAEAAAAARVIRSGWVTQGPEVAAFEREFAALVGASHACAVSSCTTALHLALRAVGVKPGGEVITVSHSFIATANSIRYCDAVPVFVDIELGTYNLDPDGLENSVTPRTQAILCVHQLGMPCDLRQIIAVARRRGLPVIEDAACAIGSEILWNDLWERIGKPHGDIACFSFHPRKLISTGDGGMLTTASAEWDRKFRLWRQHGMSVSDTVRHSAAEVVFESYDELGYNYRMTDIQAAVGREQLKRLPPMLARRRELAARYTGQLRATPEWRTPVEPSWARTNWQSYCVGLPAGVEQRRFMQRLLDAGIATRRGVGCAHREPAYPPGTWRSDSHLRNSEEAQERSIILPLFHQLSEPDQDRVIHELLAAGKNS